MSVINHHFVCRFIIFVLLAYCGITHASEYLPGHLKSSGQKINSTGTYHTNNQRIIIKFKTPSRSVNFAENRVLMMNQQFNTDFEFRRLMSGQAEVWNVNGFDRSLYSDLSAVIQQLNQDPSVEYAEEDVRMVPHLVPNDSLYNQQWHYKDTIPGMRLPGAWDVSTGSIAVNVAVLDTGYRPHPDLLTNVVNEYDMINDLATANDGDLRDGNAQDPGDAVVANECYSGSPARDSSWHGTHVGGTVAAVSNNAMGVTGVAWNVGLIPVRVLGKCGGWGSDIADGIRWAAGLNVPGVPDNILPADVINMSLGSNSPGACGATYQTAIDDAYNAGTTVVTSAGNSNANANYQPGNCNNVISVAASANDGARAYYSNFGPAVDITAPGGDGCNPINNNYPGSLSDCEGGVWDPTRMVLSTHNAGTTVPAADNYNWLQGTSMASPHVAGLAALIKSVNPNLTPAQVEQIIKNTAEPFATVPDHQCSTGICGAGYANATAALQHTLVTLGPDLIFSNGFESDIIFKNGFE